MKIFTKKSVMRLLAILLVIPYWVSAQRATAYNGNSYAAIDTLDALAGLQIDTSHVYTSRSKAKSDMNKLIEEEYKLLSNTELTKSVKTYPHHMAAQYGHEVKCTKMYTKKDLGKRWRITKEYVTVRDTLFEEIKDLTGVNLGSDHHPIGTHKPIEWHTKYKYDDCDISFIGCSNIDGDDNFMLYTKLDRRCDTICNVCVPRAVGIDRLIYKNRFRRDNKSPVYIKIYNSSNVNYSPGACSAFLIVKPKVPVVRVLQKLKRIRISKII